MSPLPLRPSYLRIVVTTSCPLRCDYCHMEGDPWSGGPRGLDGETLSRLLEAAARCGIQKFKYLGGEPLARRDLPEITARLRAAAPRSDISVISSGVGAPDRFDALFDAGLDRANLSIHGWSLASFSRRGGTDRGFALRQACIDRVLAQGRLVKLNYVIDGTEGDDLTEIDDGKVESYVVQNRRLSALRHVPESADRYRAFGLDRPWLTVQFDTIDGPHRLLISKQGDQEEINRYAVVDGMADVFVISTDKVGDLLRTVDHFTVD